MNEQKFNEQIQQLCLMDDIFFNICMDGAPECIELILQIILDDADLKVIEVSTQRNIANFKYHSVRFDVFATSNGKIYDIEVQRSDEGAIPRRARYNASMLDSKELRSGVDYDKLPESYVIFITENDVIGENKPLYHIKRVVEETGKAFNDGSYIIYVNGKNRDDTALGKLMQDFFCANPNKMNYSILANRTDYIKNDEFGGIKMSPILKEWLDDSEKRGEERGEKRGEERGEKRGELKAKTEIIIEMLKANQPIEMISKFTKLTVDKIKDIAKQNDIIVE